MNNIGNMLHGEKMDDAVEDSLMKYCKSGNYKQVVHIFDKFWESPGFDINCRDRDGNTALILAAKQGHGSIVQELLQHMPDISLANKKCQTAVEFTTNPIMKLIFGCVSTCMPYSERMFCNACWLGNIDVVERCLARERGIPLRNLCNLDGVHCLILPLHNLQLLENGATGIRWPYKPSQVVIALLTHLSDIPSSCSTLLHIVAKSNAKCSLGIASALLNRYFDVLDTDEYGFTALHCAARSGNIAVLNILLTRSKHGTSRIIDITCKSGYTPLHLAAMNGHEMCVKTLIELGASKQVTNDEGYTPVQLSKSVRIRNLFQTPEKSTRQILLPDSAFVLTRSNTAVPRTPASMTSRFGKKSAEPYPNRKENFSESYLEPREPTELIETCIVQKKPISFSYDNSLVHDVLTKLPSISARSLLTPDKQRRKFSHSISLDCLEEEIIVEPVASPVTHPDEEAPLQTCNKISNNKVLKHVKGSSKSNKKTNPQKSKRDLPKPLKSKLTPLLNKSTVRNKGPKPKPIEATTKENFAYNIPLPIENIEILSDNDIIYESDFNTDNSSSQGDLKEILIIEIDSEGDELNNTLTNSTSSGTTTHISWRKGEQLGKGSYGTVWKGMLEDGQYIAVKEIIVTEEDELSECGINNSVEIKREIEILQTLSHKNIVKYLGTCDSHSCIHILMEFVSGGSIAYILTKFGGFSENIVRRYSKQMVDAISFLNLNGVIHRDIKGANVMVTPKGVIKLIDFGCAKRMQNFNSVSRSAQQQSRLHGSVYWMAPEVINGSGHNHKSDVWSLGCTIIEMITTRPPWVELHPFAAMFAIGSGNKEAPNLRGYITGDGISLSDNASDFINMCLIRDRISRPKAADLLLCAFFK